MKLRLPQSFLVLALIAAACVAVISGGVAASQAMGGLGWRGADWTVFRWACGALAAVGALAVSGLVDWIGDKELDRLRIEDEVRAEAKAGGRGFFRSWRLTSLMLLVIVFEVAQDWAGDRFFDMNGPDGATLMGSPLGVFRILGRTWTGVELGFTVPLVVALVLLLRAGFARLAKANRPR